LGSKGSMVVAHPVPGPSIRRAVLLAVLGGGWIAGTVDIGSACLINSLPPPVILQAIASGVLGASAFHDGLGAVLAGLLLQWAMAQVIAGVYVSALVRWPKLGRHPLGGGSVYGIVLYGVMNYVVVPLSAAPFGPPVQPLKRLENLLAMVAFGVIVAVAARLAGAPGSARRDAPGA
jgi:uncharacterized membrane protein YagU involved in acid resistance